MYKWWSCSFIFIMGIPIPSKTILYHDGHSVYCEYLLQDNGYPRYQGSCGQHGAHLGPVGPRWALWWPYGHCYQVCYCVLCLYLGLQHNDVSGSLTVMGYSSNPKIIPVRQTDRKTGFFVLHAIIRSIFMSHKCICHHMVTKIWIILRCIHHLVA